MSCVQQSGRLLAAFESGGGSTSMFVRLGQVIFTLTQFPAVESVRFSIEGRPVSVFSGEGIVIDHPQARADAAAEKAVMNARAPTGSRPR